MVDDQVLVCLAKINAADRMISALSKPAGSTGSKTWTMSMETYETDPDVVIGEALTAASTMIFGLIGENERLRARLKAE